MDDKSSIPKIFLPVSESTKSYTGKEKIKSGLGIGRWLSYVNSKKYKEIGAGTRIISREELSSHSTPEDMWMALQSSGRLAVYDISPFAPYHPGGLDLLIENSGMDASEAFRMAHSYVNVNMISKLRKGYLASEPAAFGVRKFLSPSMIQKKSLLSSRKPTWQWHQYEQTESDGGTVAISVSIAIPEQRLASQQLPLLQLQNYRTLAVWRPADPRGELLIRVHLDNAVYYCLTFRLLPSLIPQLPTLRTTPTDAVDKSTSAEDETNVRRKTTSPLTVSLKLGIQAKSSDSGSAGTSDTRTFSTIGSVLCDQLVPSTEVFDAEVETSFLSCRVLESTRLENTRYRLLKLAWPENNAWIPIPFGHHVMVRLYNKSGEPVYRPYTPVCSSTTLDSGVVSELSTGASISLLVKVYPDGRMSPLLDQLSPGDAVDISLPMGTVDFSAGVGADGRSPEVLFILAAGSGITPMLRPLAAALFPATTEQAGAPSVHMVCFDRDRQDQVLVEELRRLSDQFPDRFSILRVLSRPTESLPSTDSFVHGQIDENLCTLGLFTLHLDGLEPENVQDRALWLICGPRGFNEAAISVARKWGVPSRCLVVFSG